MLPVLFSFCSHVPKKLMAVFPCSLKPVGEPHLYKNKNLSYLEFTIFANTEFSDFFFVNYLETIIFCSNFFSLLTFQQKLAGTKQAKFMELYSLHSTINFIN